MVAIRNTRCNKGIFFSIVSRQERNLGVPTMIEESVFDNHISNAPSTAKKTPAPNESRDAVVRCIGSKVWNNSAINRSAAGERIRILRNLAATCESTANTAQSSPTIVASSL